MLATVTAAPWSLAGIRTRPVDRLEEGRRAGLYLGMAMPGCEPRDHEAIWSPGSGFSSDQGAQGGLWVPCLT